MVFCYAQQAQTLPWGASINPDDFACVLWQLLVALLVYIYLTK